MITKGGTRSNGGNLAAHLLRNDNEKIVIVELKNTATQDLSEALNDMEATLKMTKGKKGLYHAQINPAIGEAMTPKQWKYAVDEMEKRLGLDDQPRAVVYHEKKGRPHMHVVWQRTDIEQGKVIGNSNDYYIHKQLGRDLEKEFGHKQLHNEFTGQWEKMAEKQQLKRDGYNSVKQLKARVKEVYQSYQDPAQMRSELGKIGYELARGKKGAVIVSKEGEIHSLMRYAGEKKKDVQERLKPIYDQLPEAENIRDREKTRKEITKLKPLTRPQRKKTFAENAFYTVKVDELDKSAAKFEMIQKDFKKSEQERKIQEMESNFSKDNTQALQEQFEQMRREAEERRREMERERERSLNRW